MIRCGRICRSLWKRECRSLLEGEEAEASFYLMVQMRIRGESMTFELGLGENLSVSSRVYVICIDGFLCCSPFILKSHCCSLYIPRNCPLGWFRFKLTFASIKTVLQVISLKHRSLRKSSPTELFLTLVILSLKCPLPPSLSFPLKEKRKHHLLRTRNLAILVRVSSITRNIGLLIVVMGR